MLGNGSDELISLLALACDVPGAAVLAPLPGFVMYADVGAAAGPDVRRRAADGRLRARRSGDAGRDRASTARRITYLAYPNNPTANLCDDAVIERIIAAVGAQDGLVVFDEAYQPFSSRTLDAAHGARTTHVLVMRTLSKFGLAGVRLGYLVGAAALIDEIDKVRPPYNISVLNAEATLFALEHADEFARQAAMLRARARAAAGGAARHARRDGLFPSEANMILVRVPDAKRAFEGMKAARRAGQERRRTAPAAGQLPAPDRRHAGGKHA